MYDFIWSQVRPVTKMLQRIKSVLEVTWRRCYDVSRASWKLLEEDVTTYQERLGSYLKKMLRRIKSVLEVTWRRCNDVSRASWKLLEEDVTTFQERLGSYLKKMLRRIKSVLEVTRRRCYDVSRASWEVAWRRCYDVSRASWKFLEEDVTTYQERLGSYLKKTLRRIKSVLEATWRKCYDISGASWKLLEEDVYDVSRASWKLLEDRWRRCCNVAMLQRLWNADERTLLHPPKPPFNPPKARHLQKWQQSRPSRGAAAINYPSKTITIRD